LILLRLPEGDGPGFLTLTEAGMLAKIGMNTLGFGICLNILRSVGDGKQAGVPVHVLLRALLGCRSVGDAISLAGKLSFAASSNVLCADVRGDAASLELSPLGVRVVRGTEPRYATRITSSPKVPKGGSSSSPTICRPNRAWREHARGRPGSRRTASTT
jgi:isopenicillin-N N-acyltransferase-like protein